MNKYLVPNLGKAVQMLKLMSEAHAGMSAVEIETALSVPRTTTFRILKTLLHEGMVEKRGTHFFASAGLFEMGLQALSKSNLRELAVPLLKELTLQTGQTSHLAIPSGWHSLILEVCDSPNPVQVASRPGTLADLHCSATGKVFLSHVYLNRLEEFIATFQPKKRTQLTRIQLSDLVDMTKTVRQNGYAQDEQEYHDGVRCLAAPVFDMRHQVVAAIGVTGPVTSFTEHHHPTILESVLQTAKKLSNAMGYK